MTKCGHSDDLVRCFYYNSRCSTTRLDISDLTLDAQDLSREKLPSHFLSLSALFLVCVWFISGAARALGAVPDSELGELFIMHYAALLGQIPSSCGVDGACIQVGRRNYYCRYGPAQLFKRRARSEWARCEISYARHSAIKVMPSASYGQLWPRVRSPTQPSCYLALP